MRYFTYVGGWKVGAQTNRKIAIRDASILRNLLRKGVTIRVFDMKIGEDIYNEVS